jgi:hypothetical protein
MIGNAPMRFRQSAKPFIVAPGSSHDTLMEGWLILGIGTLPRGERHLFQVVYWVKNEKKERFTVTGDLLAAWRGDVLTYYPHLTGTVPGWNNP